MRYPVLQSGYLSLTEVGMNSPKLETNSFSETILGQSADNSLADYFFSIEVEKLISQWKNRPEAARTPEFKEKTIEAAFKCFSASSISTWIEMQSLRPTLGRLHKEFIVDTMLFVYHDKPRSVEALQWARLLFPESGGSQQIRVATMFESKYNRQYAPISGFDLSIESFVGNWLTRKDGYIDMLKCLHVIFGRRSGSGAHQTH